MTSYELFIEFLAAKTQAEELERIASRLRRMANHNLGDELNHIAKNWRSPNASDFIKKGNRLREKLLAEAKSLENDADVIRRISKRVYDTEMEALSIAKKRTYR